MATLLILYASCGAGRGDEALLRRSPRAWSLLYRDADPHPAAAEPPARRLAGAVR